MALTEAEELELLELEEQEAMANQSASASQAYQPTFLENAGQAIGGISNAILGPVARAGETAARGFSKVAFGTDIPVDVAQKALALPQQAGEYIAEKGGELGYPKTGATLGMIAANAPFFAIPGGSPIKAGPVTRAVGRGASRVGEALSGVSARDIQGLFKKPGTLFKTGSKAKAGEAIGEAEVRAGINPGVTESAETMTLENVEKALNVAKTGEQALKDIAQTKTGTPEQIADALQYVGDEIKGKLAQGKDASQLINIQTHLNGLLEKVSPEIQKARQEFAPLAQRNKFIQVFPRNKNQSISKANLMYLGTGLAGAGTLAGGPIGGALAVLGGTALRSPITTGLATVGASIGSKVASGVVNSPAFRKALYSQFVDRIIQSGSSS